MIHGENKESEADEQDGRHSPPPFGDAEGSVVPPMRTSNLGPESSCPNFEAIQSTTTQSSTSTPGMRRTRSVAEALVASRERRLYMTVVYV